MRRFIDGDPMPTRTTGVEAGRFVVPVRRRVRTAGRTARRAALALLAEHHRWAAALRTAAAPARIGGHRPGARRRSRPGASGCGRPLRPLDEHLEAQQLFLGLGRAPAGAATGRPGAAPADLEQARRRSPRCLHPVLQRDDAEDEDERRREEASRMGNTRRPGLTLRRRPRAMSSAFAHDFGSSAPPTRTANRCARNSNCVAWHSSRAEQAPRSA